MKGTKTPTTDYRGQNDAALAIGGLAVGLLVALIVLVVIAKFLSNLPPMIATGLVFSLMVFSAAVAATFLRTKPVARRQGPPELRFPAGRRKAKPRRRTA